MAKHSASGGRSRNRSGNSSGRPAPAARTDLEVPAVGPREPCPCGSGRRYKACHGRAARMSQAFVARPFEGLAAECDWVALREFVPAATARATLKAPHDDRELTIATLLPFVAAGIVTPAGEPILGLQVPSDAGDPSREYAAVIESLLTLSPASVVPATGVLTPGPRLQDLLEVGAPLDITMHTSFDYWLDAVADENGAIAAGVERANAVISPTERVDTVSGAYWCEMTGRHYLRWVRPEPEDALVNAFARLHVRHGDTVGEGTRYIGAFRAHGLLVSVWELPPALRAADLPEPLAALDTRLQEALGDLTPLSDSERSARSGLLNRQRTVRSGS